MRLSVKTIENVAKLIDSLVDKSDGNYTFHVWSDEYQSHQEPQDRWFTVEIADYNDGERFILDSENAPTYTLDEAKKVLDIEEEELK